ITCYFCVPTGVSSTYTVLQTPPSIIKKVGQSVSSQIHCSHNVSIFDRILWYKQDEHRALKFLGYLNGEYPYPEDDVKGKISFDGNARKHSNLTISNVSVTDSAVYFCAASTVLQIPLKSIQKPLLMSLQRD
uniref:Ig-like domain-containing protein n=1 Tax=Oreochromis niloticus TaxID=8128 RepID=A0A669DPZ4_ORENI